MACVVYEIRNIPAAADSAGARDRLLHARILGEHARIGQGLLPLS
jgi:hypothetical protein